MYGACALSSVLLRAVKVLSIERKSKMYAWIIYVKLRAGKKIKKALSYIKVPGCNCSTVEYSEM
jgi:hypothetical protein